MARILYGVSGDGFGHAARSKEIISFLISQGHEVKVLSYDRGYSWLKNFFDTTEIFGLRFTYQDNELKYLPTLFRNVMSAPEAIKSIEAIRSIIKKFKPQLVITDFEPMSAAAAHLNHLPLLSIDNQHLLTRAAVEYPLKYEREALAARIVTRLMVISAKSYLVTNFFEAPVTETKTKILPAIVRSEVLAAKPANGDYCLVYLTSDSEEVPQKLKGLPQKFRIYGVSNRFGQDGNLEYKKFDRSEFLADLAGCRAIVANAGLSLISEALYLGKPYLAVPAKRQFEQVLNAYYLDKLGYGLFSQDLAKADVEKFFNSLDTYRQHLSKYPRLGNQVFMEAVKAEVNKYVKL